MTQTSLVAQIEPDTDAAGRPYSIGCVHGSFEITTSDGSIYVFDVDRRTLLTVPAAWGLAGEPHLPDIARRADGQALRVVSGRAPLGRPAIFLLSDGSDGADHPSRLTRIETQPVTRIRPLLSVADVESATG